MNTRGYEQLDGVHFTVNQDSNAAPVANEIVIQMALVLFVMASWWVKIIGRPRRILDWKKWTRKKGVILQVPEGFSKYYCPGNVVLKMLKTLYGLKQNASVFWKSLVQAFRHMAFDRSGSMSVLQVD
jgi:hypothetical protein